MQGSPRVSRSYGDQTAIRTGTRRVYARGIADLFSSFGRANFRVDSILEPMANEDARRGSFWIDSMAKVPATLILRGRKDGI